MLDIVGLLARLTLAVVWLVAGLIKAAEPYFLQVAAVKAFQLAPESLVGTIAVVQPYLEIAIGLLLLLGLATRLAAVLSVLAMVVFLVGVISAAARGLSIDCGCFGGGGTVAPGATEYTLEILRDTGLLILAVYLMLRPATPLSVDRWTARRTEVPA